MFGNVKLDKQLLARVKKYATIAGYTSPEEFIAHALEKELAKLQIELVKLQEWIRHQGLKVVVIFEGRDAAGKGGVIKRITEKLNPRVCRVVALQKPSDRERTQWYFQRYVPHLPSGGEIVLFDRSWYNRSGVERVMGFASPEQVEQFFQDVPEFEKMLVRSGIRLIKYWFSISDEEQQLRFLMRIHDPLKQWKLTDEDWRNRDKRAQYEVAVEEMLARTSWDRTPWFVIPGESKRLARVEVLETAIAVVEAGMREHGMDPVPPLD